MYENTCPEKWRTDDVARNCRKKGEKSLMKADGGRRKRRRSLVSGEKRTLKCHLGRGSMAVEAPPLPENLSTRRAAARGIKMQHDEIVSDRWRVYSSEVGVRGDWSCWRGSRNPSRGSIRYRLLTAKRWKLRRESKICINQARRARRI